MKTENLYRYYMFGYNYYMLRNGLHSTSQALLKSLNDYVEFIKELDLSVTYSGTQMKNLDTEIDELKRLVLKKDTKVRGIDPIFKKRLQSKLTEIDNILDAELYTKFGYIPSEKRYPLKHLTENPSRLFGSGVYDALPKVAAFDFKECGMCLVLDRYTACAFHALRGTEDVLGLYYSKLLGKSVTANTTWGSILNAMSSAIKSKAMVPAPPEEMMVSLESLRKYYRNKTQHPILMYSGDEVQDLLGVCVKAVNNIIQDLFGRKLLP